MLVPRPPLSLMTTARSSSSAASVSGSSSKSGSSSSGSISASRQQPGLARLELLVVVAEGLHRGVREPLAAHLVQAGVQAVGAHAAPEASVAAMSSQSWDAATYDRVSDVQQAWAEAVLERLRLRGDETVLDAGCGSGAVTRRLLERLPRGRVVAVDASAEMVAHAAAALGPRATVFQADLASLELDEPVDAVFSNAVFHWVLDHDAPVPRAARRR